MDYVIERFSSGMHFIVLDEQTVAALTESGNRRVICRLNGEVALHCAIMPKKEGGHFVNIGLATCKKLQLRVGQWVAATFVVDETAYQFDVPEELSEVLATDDEANAHFHALTAGNKRGLIYLVTQVKSSEKRIARALKIAECIKAGITSPRLILK